MAFGKHQGSKTLHVFSQVDEIPERLFRCFFSQRTDMQDNVEAGPFWSWSLSVTTVVSFHFFNLNRHPFSQAAASCHWKILRLVTGLCGHHAIISKCKRQSDACCSSTDMSDRWITLHFPESFWCTDCPVKCFDGDMLLPAQVFMLSTCDRSTFVLMTCFPDTFPLFLWRSRMTFTVISIFKTRCDDEHAWGVIHALSPYARGSPCVQSVSQISC